jgi:hypothetical protein
MGKYQKMAFSPGRTLHPAKALKQKFFKKFSKKA